MHEAEIPSARQGKRQPTTLPWGDLNELELLSVAHPGEFNLVSSSRDPFLVLFDRGLGHDCDG